MGEDEAGTLTALRALRKELPAPKVVENHGRMVKQVGETHPLVLNSSVQTAIMRNTPKFEDTK